MSANDFAIKDAVAWARAATDDAVKWFVEKGVVEGAVLEAKPAWAAPPAAFIAMLREQGVPDRFFWLIGGSDFHFDYIDSSVAASAREAARHFFLKWQLEVARLRESATAAGVNPDDEADPGNVGARLEQQAEALYRLVSDDALWQRGSPADPRSSQENG